MRTKFISGLVVAVYLFTGCVQRDIMLPSQPVEPQLVVLAYLVDGAPAEVFVSKLLPLDIETIDFGVPTALVTLYKYDSVATTFRYSTVYGIACDDLNPDGVCPFKGSKHISEDSLALQDGAVYRIEVQAAGFPTVRSEPVVFNRNLQNVSMETVVTDTITGSSSNRKALTIDTITVNYDYTGDREDLLYLYLQYDREEYEASGWQGNMLSPIYNWRIPLNHTGGRQQFVHPGPAIDKRPAGFPIEHSFSVNITRYPADFIRFYESVQAQDLEISGLYAGAPSSISTNLTGGLGYFVILENYVGDYYVLQ